MVVDFALPYMSQGETLAERKNRLTLACVPGITPVSRRKLVWNT